VGFEPTLSCAFQTRSRLPLGEPAGFEPPRHSAFLDATAVPTVGRRVHVRNLIRAGRREWPSTRSRTARPGVLRPWRFWLPFRRPRVSSTRDSRPVRDASCVSCLGMYPLKRYDSSLQQFDLEALACGSHTKVLFVPLFGKQVVCVFERFGSCL